MHQVFRPRQTCLCWGNGRQGQLPAQQLRQQRVAQDSEGAGLGAVGLAWSKSGVRTAKLVEPTRFSGGVSAFTLIAHAEIALDNQVPHHKQGLAPRKQKTTKTTTHTAASSSTGKQAKEENTEMLDELGVCDTACDAVQYGEWAKKDSNLRRLSQQIYNLSSLTT